MTRNRRGLAVDRRHFAHYSGPQPSPPHLLRRRSPKLVPKLSATCDLKPPIYGDFAAKLESARIEGLNVDACYDSNGTMNFVRMCP